MGKPEVVLDPAVGTGGVHQRRSGPRALGDRPNAFGDRPQSKGIHTIVSDMFDVELPPGHFDGVLLSNLLEHLMTYEDIQRCLRKMHAAIRPGGVVAVLGPNFKYCADEYFDCADHVLALTHISVQEHLYAAGFDIRSVLPRYLPYSFRGRLPPSKRPDSPLPAQSLGVPVPGQAVPRHRRGLTRPTPKEGPWTDRMPTPRA